MSAGADPCCRGLSTTDGFAIAPFLVVARQATTPPRGPQRQRKPRRNAEMTPRAGKRATRGGRGDQDPAPRIWLRARELRATRTTRTGPPTPRERLALHCAAPVPAQARHVNWRAAIDFESTTTLSAPSTRHSSRAIAIEDATVCGREAGRERAGGTDEVFLVNRLALKVHTWVASGGRRGRPASLFR